MKALIEEFNDKLKVLLEELKGKKAELETSLAEVQEKIDVKIEEAKRYKVDVDDAKREISKLEGEISSLEDDLADLTNRFSNRDLGAILETGNKEINNQIVIRQSEIARQREKINEYTEKARTIKDLLISLKRDKESKKNKLLNCEGVYKYYLDELNRVMRYAEENPNDLATDEESSGEAYVYENEPVIDEDKPIFDEIESIDKEPDVEETFIEPVEVPFEEEPAMVVESKQKDENNIFDNDLEENHVHEEDLYKDESNINDLFARDSKDSFDSFDFKALSDTIDKEYESIFGSSLGDAEDLLSDEEVPKVEEKEIVDPIEGIPYMDEDPLAGLNENESMDNAGEFNFFGDTEPIEDIIKEPVNEQVLEPISEEPKQDNIEIVNFFASNNLDFNKFSKEDQEKLEKYFNLVNFTKTLDILRKNNINLEYLYGSADIFKVIHSELESIISKLLVAGQSSTNISYVLNALPLINSFDLQDVIDSYGPQIKEANITDLIVKAKHLKELGGV